MTRPARCTWRRKTSALWKYSAEPDGGSERTLIASIEEMAELEADLEGVGIYYGTGGAGYIIVSSQGNDSYAVFDRQGERAYLGSFVITANTALGIDGCVRDRRAGRHQHRG